MPSVTIVKTATQSPGNQEADLMRRALAVLTLVVCTVGLAGCGDDDSSGSGDGTDLPTKTIDVTITGDTCHTQRGPGLGGGQPAHRAGRQGRR